MRRLGPPHQLDGWIACLGALGVRLPRRLLHVGEQLPVIDPRCIVVLDVSVLGITDDDTPPFGRENVESRRHEHAEGLRPRRVAPGAQHDLGLVGIEVPEVGWQLQGGEAAPYSDPAYLVAELRLDLLPCGVVGRALETLGPRGHGQYGEERQGRQEQGRSAEHARNPPGRIRA